MLGNPSLSRRARAAIEDSANEAIVSVVSVWEIAPKVRIGKMPQPGDLLKDPHTVLSQMGFRDLPMTLSHAQLGGSLVHPHRDPFDRMLAAQALVERLALVSIDTVFDGFGVTRLW